MTGGVRADCPIPSSRLCNGLHIDSRFSCFAPGRAGNKVGASPVTAFVPPSMPPELSRREQNVIRRLLNRAEFRPLDVATLGYTRLAAAPGLGAKGLRSVLDWLKAEGFVLEESVPPARPDPHLRMHRRIESARHLLEQWGWQVRQPDTESFTHAQGPSE